MGDQKIVLFSFKSFRHREQKIYKNKKLWTSKSETID